MKRATAILSGLLMAGTISVQLLALRHRPDPDAAATDTCGRYTRQQAIDMSTPLFQAMLPQAHDLYADARFQNLIRRDGVMQPLWIVDCGQTADATQVQAIYDAITGRLQHVSSEGKPLPTGTDPLPLTAQTATTRAQVWMNRIMYRIASPGRWRLLGQPTHHQAIWHVALSSSDRRATLVIDGRDGSLLSADIK